MLHVPRKVNMRFWDLIWDMLYDVDSLNEVMDERPTPKLDLDQR